MPSSPKQFPPGPHLMDLLGTSVLARVYPVSSVREALDCVGSARRRRRLPGEVMVYYVIAMGMFHGASLRETLLCLREGLRWIGKDALKNPPVKSAITQARERLGTVTLKKLRDLCVHPLAHRETCGAWFNELRLVAFDGTTLNVPDVPKNRVKFGLPGSSRGASAFPQVRLTTLAELGTRAAFAWHQGPLSEGEVTQAKKLVPHLKKGMLVLADRGFWGFPLWLQAIETGAELLWRAKSNSNLPVLEVYPDGSYRSFLQGNQEQGGGQVACPVRVVEYRLENTNGVTYRLVTTLTDPAVASAVELATLYRQRWEIECAYDEIKAHLFGNRPVLRSRVPELVEQEVDGLMLAHFAIRSLIHEAAQKAGEDPDRLSFTHAFRVVSRRLSNPGAFPPSGGGYVNGLRRAGR